MILLSVLVSVLIALYGCSEGEQQAHESNDGPTINVADTVYTNGKIYTVDEAQPWA